MMSSGYSDTVMVKKVAERSRVQTRAYGDLNNSVSLAINRYIVSEA